MIKTRRDFMRSGAAALATLPVLAATAARAQTTHTVTITNFAFTPQDLTIAAGDTVTWVNEGSAGHSAWESAGDAFDTGIIRRGNSASLTFTSAGQFNYRCRPHGNMTGTITIT